jgi:DNA-directed RNA polymerase specialized sigma24 family protein
MTMPLPAPAPGPAEAVPQAPTPTDTELAARARRGDGLAFELIMRRHNRRLFRLARSLLRNDAEAEDVLQEAYVRAYAGLGELVVRQALAAWLARIVANEALGRLRGRAPVVSLEDFRAKAATARLPTSRTRSAWPPAASCAGCSRRRWTRCPRSSARCSCCARSRG